MLAYLSGTYTCMAHIETWAEQSITSRRASRPWPCSIRVWQVELKNDKHLPLWFYLQNIYIYILPPCSVPDTAIYKGGYCTMYLQICGIYKIENVLKRVTQILFSTSFDEHPVADVHWSTLSLWRPCGPWGRRAWSRRSEGSTTPWLCNSKESSTNMQRVMETLFLLARDKPSDTISKLCRNAI